MNECKYRKKQFFSYFCILPVSFLTGICVANKILRENSLIQSAFFFFCYSGVRLYIKLVIGFAREYTSANFNIFKWLDFSSSWKTVGFVSLEVCSRFLLGDNFFLLFFCVYIKLLEFLFKNWYLYLSMVLSSAHLYYI